MDRRTLSDFLNRWGRRSVTIPAYLLACVLVIGTLPVMLPTVLVRDVIARSRFAWTRSLAFGALYLACESLGIAVSFLIWVGSGAFLGINRRGFLNANYALQRWWTNALFEGVRFLFKVRLEVESDERVDTGPILLFFRHASLPDVIMPSALFIVPHGMRIRHVMKSELLWDPCLDIVGHRIPNCFVRRGSGESAREIEKIRNLVREVGPNEGMMIYPEGTRFTTRKRERFLEQLRKSGDDEGLARAAAMKNVLPPRLGGSLAMLENNPGAAAVFCAHVGFESVATAKNLLGGSLIGQTIRVRLWRIPFEEIPTTTERRIAWLFDQWSKVDAWIGAHQDRPSVEPASTAHHSDA